jgi:hypothetical protein
MTIKSHLYSLKCLLNVFFKINLIISHYNKVLFKSNIFNPIFSLFFGNKICVSGVYARVTAEMSWILANTDAGKYSCSSGGTTPVGKQTMA